MVNRPFAPPPAIEDWGRGDQCEDCGYPLLEQESHTDWDWYCLACGRYIRIIPGTFAETLASQCIQAQIDTEVDWFTWRFEQIVNESF